MSQHYVTYIIYKILPVNNGVHACINFRVLPPKKYEILPWLVSKTETKKIMPQVPITKYSYITGQEEQHASQQQETERENNLSLQVKSQVNKTDCDKKANRINTSRRNGPQEVLLVLVW